MKYHLWIENDIERIELSACKDTSNLKLRFVKMQNLFEKIKMFWVRTSQSGNSVAVSKHFEGIAPNMQLIVHEPKGLVGINRRSKLSHYFLERSSSCKKDSTWYTFCKGSFLGIWTHYIIVEPTICRVHVEASKDPFMYETIS